MDDTDFITLSMAIGNIQTANGKVNAREYCINHLSNGLIKARAFRARVTSEYMGQKDLINAYLPHYKNDEDDDDDLSIDFTKIDRANLFKGFYDITTEDYWTIPEDFWHRSLLNSQKEWLSIDSSPWIGKMIWADWETFEFDVISIRSDGSFKSGEQRYYAQQVYVVGVSIERRAISSLLHNNLTMPQNITTESKPSEAEKTWQYDWLGAFANVAAKCRYNDVIQDINKRGSKAEIVDIMKDWFSNNQPKIPGDSILKEKADILHKELKKQFGRSPQ